MDLVAFVKFLQHRKIFTDYVYINAVALFIYDYFLTLHLEIKLIWNSRWTYTKIVFLLVRYLGFGYSLLVTYAQFHPNISAESCKVMYATILWLLVVHTMLAESILAIRTWAVWQRNRLVGIILAIAVSTYLFVQCPLLNTFLHAVEFAPPPYPGFVGCFLASGKRNLWDSYLVLAMAEVVVLAPLVISAYLSYRRGSIGELSYVIYRDGILLYFYLLCITVANLALTLLLPIDVTTVLSPLGDVLYTVLTTRVVLSIRNAANRGQNTELHTSYYESPPFVVPPPVTSDDHDQDNNTLP